MYEVFLEQVSSSTLKLNAKGGKANNFRSQCVNENKEIGKNRLRKNISVLSNYFM